MSSILITGASGLVGGELLFKNQGKRDICLLVHKNLPSPLLRLPRVKVVRGDISKPNLGTSKKDFNFLSSQVTEIIHCAAKTDFSISSSLAEKVNVIGTKNVIEFAARCKRISKVGVLSTVYVAGKRKGRVFERELDARAGFVNEYEASKFRMEKFLQERMERLPIAIYRLSTILGSSKTGEVKQFNAIHQALRLYFHGLIPMVPGNPQAQVDFISSEYAANSIHYLFNKKFKAGSTHHIIAGKRNSLTLEDFLIRTYNLFCQSDKEWMRKGFEVPPIVEQETFNTLAISIEKTEGVFLKQIIRAMNYFVPQLSYPKTFEDKYTQAALKGSGIHEKSIQSYYPKIIQYCLESKWGTKK